MRPTERVSLVFLFAGLLITRLCHTRIVWVEEAYPTAAAIQLLHGRALYNDVWFDKPPLFPAVYLLWNASIGVPLRVAGAVFTFACCLLLYRLAARSWSTREGFVAAMLLGFFLTFGIPSAVIALAPDLLMIAPHIAAVYFAVRGKPLIAGLLAGIGLLINSKAVFVLAVCLLWLWRDWAWTLLGFALPNVAAFAWFGRNYYEQVWKWGAAYSQHAFPLATGFVRTADWLGFQSAIVVGAIWFLWKERSWRMLAWLVISMLGVAAGGRFFPRYYFQLLVPVVMMASRGYVLLAGCGKSPTQAGKPVPRVPQDIDWPCGRGILACVPLGRGDFFRSLPGRCRAVLLLLLLIPLARFGPRYVLLANDLLHGRAHQWSDVRLNQDSEAAARFLDHKRGTLLVWGYRPDVFAYTRMPAGTRFLDSQPLTGVIADRHLTNSEASFPELAASNRKELTETRPTFIVDGLGPLNPALAITNYPDLREWLGAYHEIGRTDLSVVYERTP